MLPTERAVSTRRLTDRTLRCYERDRGFYARGGLYLGMTRQARAGAVPSVEDSQGEYQLGGHWIVLLVGESCNDQRRIERLLASGVIVMLTRWVRAAGPLLPDAPEAMDEARSHAVISVDELVVDLAQHRVLWGRKELHVSERELSILAILAADPGRACSFAEVGERAGLGPYLGNPDAVRSAVKRLRKKLMRARVPVLIESARGFGFRLRNVGHDPLPGGRMAQETTLLLHSN